MNAHAPPEKKSRGELVGKTARKTNGFGGDYHFCQHAATGQINNNPATIVSLSGCRPCATCGISTGNQNLGGYGGKSAWRDPIYCWACADGGRDL